MNDKQIQNQINDEGKSNALGNDIAIFKEEVIEKNKGPIFKQ
jgi:hypothetical protein